MVVEKLGGLKLRASGEAGLLGAAIVRERRCFVAHPEGGFYSAEDADSEGEEGKYYLWNADELRNVLDKDESDFAIKVFNIADDGNWIDESKGIMPGTNILHLKKSNKEIADEFNLSEGDFSLRFESIRKKLFVYREKRIHPYKDDKVLTDWNGLMISALAKASQALDDKQYYESAVKACSFIEKYMTEKDGRLIHRFRDGESGLPAHIDDYAFMINALIDLYETTFEIKYLKRAIELNEILIKEFWDEQNGGFYFTSSKNEELIARQKDVYDGAIPSGNSIALLNLIRLARFKSETRFEKKASELLKYFSGYISKSPSAFSMFMCGLDFLFSSSTGEELIARQKDVYDGAVPSGNSVALLNLIRLSRFTANIYFEKKASLLIKYFSGFVSRSPSAFCMFMCGLDFQFSSPTEVVIVSEQKDNLVINGIKLIRSTFNPNKIVILKLANTRADFIELLSFANDMKMKDNYTTFFVCRNYACNQPVNSLNELKKLLTA